jgi:hypothetical protein
VFVGNAGHPHARLQRALDRDNLPAAYAAARDQGFVSLADALRLLLLIERKDPERFERAACRFVGRFAAETPHVRLADVQLVLGAVLGLRDLSSRVSLETIAVVAERYRLQTLANVARGRTRW